MKKYIFLLILPPRLTSRWYFHAGRSVCCQCFSAMNDTSVNDKVDAYRMYGTGFVWAPLKGLRIVLERAQICNWSSMFHGNNLLFKCQCLLSWPVKRLIRSLCGSFIVFIFLRFSGGISVNNWLISMYSLYVLQIVLAHWSRFTKVTEGDFHKRKKPLKCHEAAFTHKLDSPGT